MTEEKVESAKNDGLLTVGGPFDIEALFGMNQKFYEMMMTCNDELISFSRNRLKEDLDVPQKLAGCKTPQDMMNVYVGFCQTAFQQYTEEANQLAKICSDMTKDAPEIFKLPGD